MSNLPPHTERLLYSGGDWHLPGEEDADCEGALFHSPRPLFTQHTVLVKPEWWGESPEHAYWTMAPRASLCGTCRDNLDILLQMLYATDGDLDWPTRREFGNNLRALALKGWKWFADHPARPASSEAPAS